MLPRISCGNWDALIIVPPFACLERPALGPHVLQACARQAGYRVGICYANLLFASAIGESCYTAFCTAHGDLIGERIFAAAAYGVPLLGRLDEREQARMRKVADILSPWLDFEKLQGLARLAGPWADTLAAELARLPVAVIGSSTTFHQTAASLAILGRIKRLCPEKVTILGGANCEGEMAEGIRSLGTGIDHIFSGESEVTFPAFLDDLRRGQRPSQPVIPGEPFRELDLLPTPDFSDYYEQLDQFLPESQTKKTGVMWLPYESSRGCWWGQKHHCTFCGLNGLGMTYRLKTPDRVLSELKHLLSTHPTRMVQMVDNIMPHPYFGTLLPRLESELPGLHIFYEQKANLSLTQVLALKQAGVAVIQPGIESLSSRVLKLMDKGVSARQNVALMRYARSAGLALNWSLLYGFPGDDRADYQEMLELLPLLRHLNPPLGIFPLVLERFSPYFNTPTAYGISNIRPGESYASVLPDGADVGKVAYQFEGDYRSGSLEHPQLIEQIRAEVALWRQRWLADDAQPVLELAELSSEHFVLLDTRGLPGNSEIAFLTRAQAVLVLLGSRVAQSDEAKEALERRWVVELDSAIVPLATAAPELMQELAAGTRGPAAVNQARYAVA